ncbi:MAG TPA: ATP-binding cassette domain-containing protein [Vicinamibacterales bacterium]|nr:ATP-binding cassette domain-containing protein [Vicinamibacterales bacterium]
MSLSIDAGEIVGLSGPSGCGKTTLALSLLGLLPPDTEISGSISFDGRELRGMRDADLESIRGARIGLVFQESALALNPVLTAGAQIVEVVKAHVRGTHGDAVERARQALADVGFGEERDRIFNAYPHELSGGQRQRILIAQAIVCRPALVIADEPVASLDYDSRADVLALLRSLNELSGTSFLLITHSPEVLASTADRVVEMRAGTVTEATQRSTVSFPLASRVDRTRGSREALVEITGLSKTYQRRRLIGKAEPAVAALKGADLSIARGSILGVAGRSGCGKSTLARCIASLEPADAGQIRIEGTDIARLRGRALLPYRNDVQVIFQDSAAALNPRFTALDVVSEAMVIQDIGTDDDRRDISAALMGLVGLSPDRLESRPIEFSGGERQRLAIARALVSSPRLLILDETFSGLDLATRDRIMRLLIELKTTQGLTYVCISHDMELLTSFATEIAVMHDGRIEKPHPMLMPQGAVA